MADKNMTPPPMNRNGRGPMFRPREKPKNLKGTLLRLWSLTKGQRKGLGWILLLSALTSASAILFLHPAFCCQVCRFVIFHFGTCCSWHCNTH